MNRNRAILLSAFLMALLSNLPVLAAGNCFCCMYFIGGGALAAYLTWRYAHEPMDTRYGGLIGFLTGLVSVPFNMIFEYLMVDIDEMSRVIERAKHPATKEMLTALTEYCQSRLGLAVIFGFGVFILASIFSTAGGALVGHYKSRPPAPPQSYNQYPPTEPTKPPPFVPRDTSSHDEGSGI